jgi:hypothetical protein
MGGGGNLGKPAHMMTKELYVVGTLLEESPKSHYVFGSISLDFQKVQLMLLQNYQSYSLTKLWLYIHFCLQTAKHGIPASSGFRNQY